MDEFTSLLVADDTRVLVDLLKLSVCGRAGDRGREVLSAVLSGMGTAYPQVSMAGGPSRGAAVCHVLSATDSPQGTAGSEGLRVSQALGPHWAAVCPGLGMCVSAT